MNVSIAYTFDSDGTPQAQTYALAAEGQPEPPAEPERQPQEQKT